MDDPTGYRRIELAIRLTPEQMADADIVESICQQLSGLASYPWRNLTWVGAGHTCGLSGLVADGQSALLVHDSQFHSANDQTKVCLPAFRGDPVNLLWLLPVTATQQQQLEKGELTVDAVLSGS